MPQERVAGLVDRGQGWDDGHILKRIALGQLWTSPEVGKHTGRDSEWNKKEENSVCIHRKRVDQRNL